MAAARRTTPVTACLLLALVALAGIGGCAGAPADKVPDSYLSYERTYDMAFAAMADQRMIFSVQDRRQGRIVAAIDGSTLVATIQPLFEGTTRVVFEPQGNTAADAALAKRVTDSYNARMGKPSLLGGFKDSGGANQTGPVPCPSAPAFCP
jgi:hypothetical protein